MANKNKTDETEVFHIGLQDGNEILLDNKEGIWQAKLLAEGEVLVILNLLNDKHTKTSIKYLEYYSKLMGYSGDQIVSSKDNEGIKTLLSALSIKQTND